jgi:TM2 domain-containing membrane protein YozV
MAKDSPGFSKIKINISMRRKFMNEYHKKHPLISAALSFIFPGAGQLYNEEYGKGIILIAAAIASIVSIVYSGLSMGNEIMNGAALPPTPFILKIITSALIYFCLWLYGIIDGAVCAQRLSNHSFTTAESEPRQPQTKEAFIGLGVVLIVIGILGILNLLGLKFHLLIKYGWPVAIILLGCYLLAKSSGLLKGDK